MSLTLRGNSIDLQIRVANPGNKLCCAGLKHQKKKKKGDSVIPITLSNAISVQAVHATAHISYKFVIHKKELCLHIDNR